MLCTVPFPSPSRALWVCHNWRGKLFNCCCASGGGGGGGGGGGALQLQEWSPPRQTMYGTCYAAMPCNRTPTCPCQTMRSTVPPPSPSKPLWVCHSRHGVLSIFHLTMLLQLPARTSTFAASTVRNLAVENASLRFFLGSMPRTQQAKTGVGNSSSFGQCEPAVGNRQTSLSS